MPDELKKLRSADIRELPQIAAGLRHKIIDSVSRNGGHLASNCGCVELIIALHRVFNTPDEKLFFDVGHQAYAHKLLTGREEGFKKLRKADGVSGFTTPMESIFDPAVSGHAGCALSAALGHCAADPDSPDKVVAIVGDGAMGCGVTLEALNSAVSLPGSQRLILILNDNRMSISGNVGALSRVLNRVIAAPSYNRFKKFIKKILTPLPWLKKLFSSLDNAGKNMVMPPAPLFETLGFRYFGAVDGHDMAQLITTLDNVRKISGPLIVHVITEKGHGCDFAAADPTRYHGISGCDPDTGEMKNSGNGFSAAFADTMETISKENPDITAVCPAMLEGTGLSNYAEKFPDRCFDLGIAEEHALTFASGLAAAGKRPVCAFYDTFLQRALDAVYHDIALANLPVIIAVDRSGAVADGPTHHGIYTCGFLRSLPNTTILTLAAENEMLPAIRFAVLLASPVIIRYPKGNGISGHELIPFEKGKAVIRRHGDKNSPVIWALGAEVATALETADLLEKYDLDCTVIDARFLKPFDRDTALFLAEKMHITIEDHCECGGLYSALTEVLAEVSHGPVHHFAWSSEKVIPHGNIRTLKEESGLNAGIIAEKIVSFIKKI